MSDGYELKLAASAARALSIGPPDGLPPSAAEAIAAFITGALLDRPWRVGKELGKEWKGFHGARRGDYRIVYRIEEQTRVVRVVRIDHRRDVYRSR